MFVHHSFTGIGIWVCGKLGAFLHTGDEIHIFSERESHPLTSLRLWWIVNRGLFPSSS